MKKTLAIIVALVMVFGIVVACAADVPTPTPTPDAEPTPDAALAPDEAPAEELPDDPTQISGTLTHWSGTWNDGRLQELLALFNETHPNIHVNFEFGPWDGMEDRYFAAMQAGVIPDVLDLAVAWNIPFAQMGQLVAVDELAARHGLNLAATFFPGPLESTRVDGQHFGLPYRTEVGAIIYNKDLFEQAGLDPNVTPDTWEELVEMGRAIDALGGGVSGFGLSGNEAGNTTWMVYSLWMSNGVQVLTDDFTAAAFNTPAGLEVVEFWGTEIGGIAPASVLENDLSANRNLFVEGLVGMYMTGSYDLEPILDANPDINMGFFLFPQFNPNLPARVEAGGWNIAMTRTVTEENMDAAFLWMKFLASPEISVIYSDTLSAVKGTADHPAYDDPNLDVFLEAMPMGMPRQGHIAMGAVTTILYGELQAVLAGLKTAEQALNDAEARVNELLETFQ